MYYIFSRLSHKKNMTFTNNALIAGCCVHGMEDGGDGIKKSGFCPDFFY